VIVTWLHSIYTLYCGRRKTKIVSSWRIETYIILGAVVLVALFPLYLSLMLLLYSIKRIFLSNVLAFARIVLAGLQTFLTLKAGTLKGFIIIGIK